MDKMKAAEMVAAEFEKRGFEASVREVKKNNGIKYTGVMVGQKNDEIFPTYYITDTIVDRLNNGISVKKIADEMEKIAADEPDIDVSIIKNTVTNWQEAKKCIFPKLVQRKGNSTLKDIVWIPFLDMAICFYMKLDCKGEGNATVAVGKTQIQRWKVSSDDVYSQAVENLRKEEKVFCNLTDMVKDMGLGLMPMEAVPLYVLTNQDNQFGAVRIILPEVQEEISKKFGGDYFILPSSIHELLCICSEKDTDKDSQMQAFSCMVKDVNLNAVLPEEVLSDHAYYYDSKKKQIIFGS